MRQVVMNLIINASEAIGAYRRGITLTTGLADVGDEPPGQFVTEPELAPGTCVYLEVRDTGCGMDGETAKKIFDPFFTTKFSGRGLG